AFVPDASLEENLAAMASLATGVRTVEVTRAARPSRLGDQEIREGQPIALLDGELVAAAESPVAVLIAGARCAAPKPGTALTLYYGCEVAPADAEAAEARLAAEWPACGLQAVAGGQPLYD